MRNFYSKIADAYFTVATCLLLLIAGLLLLGAAWEVMVAVVHSEGCDRASGQRRSDHHRLRYYRDLQVRRPGRRDPA